MHHRTKRTRFNNRESDESAHLLDALQDLWTLAETYYDVLRKEIDLESIVLTSDDSDEEDNAPIVECRVEGCNACKIDSCTWWFCYKHRLHPHAFISHEIIRVSRGHLSPSDFTVEEDDHHDDVIYKRRIADIVCCIGSLKYIYTYTVQCLYDEFNMEDARVHLEDLTRPMIVNSRTKFALAENLDPKKKYIFINWINLVQDIIRYGKSISNPSLLLHMMFETLAKDDLVDIIDLYYQMTYLKEDEEEIELMDCAKEDEEEMQKGLVEDLALVNDQDLKFALGASTEDYGNAKSGAYLEAAGNCLKVIEDKVHHYMLEHSFHIPPTIPILENSKD